MPKYWYIHIQGFCSGLLIGGGMGTIVISTYYNHVNIGILTFLAGILLLGGTACLLAYELSQPTQE